MIFCQRCKKANLLDSEYCESCGSRLMLVSHTYDSVMFDGQENALEEHLLERISALEAALTRANERFEQLLELAQQQATGSFYDHMMLESLTEILTEMRAVDADDLEQRWRTRVARHYEETAERERLDERCELIIGAHRGTQRDQREQFIDLVEEGTLLISEGRTRRGLRMLENALALDQFNVDLCFTIGEYYFHLGKAADASSHLQRTLLQQKEHFGAQLLLGLLSGDEGQAESARNHLQHALALDDNSFAAHYSLGRLLISEGKVEEAIAHLKRALALKPTPEMHYLVGRAYWEQGREEQALKHLQKAVRLDPRFDAALYSIGWIHWQANRTNEAREHFQAAYDINPHDAHYRTAKHASNGDLLPVPPSLGWSNLLQPTGQRRKVKVNEARFAELLWRDLNTIAGVRRKVTRK
jgi:tetratricopeptide (TPR) repeat protein